MNKDTNTYEKKTVVHISTGKVFEMMTMTPQGTKWEPNPRPVGWQFGELKANGLPDRRTNPRSIGVRRRVWEDGEVDISGNYTVLRPEAEAVANTLRYNIEMAKRALNEAEDALLAHYDVLDNGPRS